MPLHVVLDFSKARRVLFCGDVHGMFGNLVSALEAVDYDASAGDRLVILGDLLDRGPDVEPIIEWLERNDSVVTLCGNHDEMLAACVGAMPMTDNAHPLTLLRNGGEWLQRYMPADRHQHPVNGIGQMMADIFEAAHEDSEGDPSDLIDERIVAFGRRMADSPTAATVLTPGGLVIGIVHADPPGSTWAETVAMLKDPDPWMRKQAQTHAMWSRARFKRMKRAKASGTEVFEALDFGLPDVDHVFLGHSIVERPITAANITWIDTGSYSNGVLTVVDPDRWVPASRRAS